MGFCETIVILKEICELRGPTSMAHNSCIRICIVFKVGAQQWAQFCHGRWGVRFVSLKWAKQKVMYRAIFFPIYPGAKLDSRGTFDF